MAADPNNPHRVAWNLDDEQGIATATLREKDSETGNYHDIATETFPLETIQSAGLGNHVALYGLSKVLQDRSSEYTSGPDKLEAMRSEFEKLEQGEWRSRGSGGAGSGGVSAVVEALANIKGISINAAQKAYKELDKDQKAKVKSNPRVSDEIERVKSQRQQSASESISLTDLAE